jgi:hypothetical protein
MAMAGFLIVGSEAVLLRMIPAVSAAMTGYTFAGEGYASMLMTGVLVGRIGGSRLLKNMESVRVLLWSAVSISTFGLLWSFLPLMTGFFADLGLPDRSVSLFLIAPVAAAVLLLRPKGPTGWFSLRVVLPLVTASPCLAVVNPHGRRSLRRIDDNDATVGIVGAVLPLDR